MPKRKLEPNVSVSAKPGSVAALPPMLPRPRVRVKPRLSNRPRATRKLRPPISEKKRGFSCAPVTRNLNNYPGLWSDLFMIINAFDQSKHTTFRDFRQLCIQKRMLDIFRGFPEVHQRLEFTETVISRCKEMWLESPTFEKQVTWFYLLCYMYFYQPQTLLTFSDLGAKIRLGINEYSTVREFRSQALIRNIPDVECLIEVLDSDDAFLFCSTAQPYGIDKCFEQYFTEDMEKLDFLSKSLTCPRLVHSLQKLKIEASETLREYCAAKEALICVESRDNTSKDLAESLSGIDTNFIDQLFSCLSRPTTSQAGSSSVPAKAGPYPTQKKV